MGEEDATWREQRRDAAAEHVAAAQRRHARETGQARELVARFVSDARARNLATVALTARPYRGSARYRTGLTGWYLKRDGTLAVDTLGDYYLLSVEPSLRARLSGVTIAPHDPPLHVGRGARDGESIDLVELLRLRLDAGDEWTLSP